LAPISNYTLVAGATLTFTNNATDADVPAQTLTFSLANAPTNATVGASSGIFNWRPFIAQADTVNPMQLIVADNGSPSLTATQAFIVTVTNPPAPVAQAGGFVGGTFQLMIDGIAGPDYTVQGSTNLTSWADLYATNSPALPFLWADPASSSRSSQFYRIKLGP
jgi:hypothetical protein